MNHYYMGAASTDQLVDVGQVHRPRLGIRYRLPLLRLHLKLLNGNDFHRRDKSRVWADLEQVVIHLLKTATLRIDNRECPSRSVRELLQHSAIHCG